MVSGPYISYARHHTPSSAASVISANSSISDDIRDVAEWWVCSVLALKK